MMPAVAYLHDKDPRLAILEQIGDLADIEIANNQVLVAVYIAPQQMKSGLWRPDSNREEDKYQSKVGLIVKTGPMAFKDDSGKWNFLDYQLNDWVFFRVSDGWNVTVNQVLCRMLDDTDLRGRIQQPDQVW